MLTTVLKSKLHQARVTHTEVEYDGSCAIDSGLLEATKIREYEQVEIYNIDNGERFTTYALEAPPGSNIISLNGAAARKAAPGDRIIICAYTILDTKELQDYQPILCYLDANNQLRESTLKSIPDHP